jgi:hypothetical protein
MSRLLRLIFISFLAILPLRASLIVATTPAALSSNDSANWSQFGANNTTLLQTFSAVSLHSLAISGSFAGGTGFEERVCPSSPACGWTTSGTGMSAGDSVIVTNNGVQGTGPLTLSFPTVHGVGAWIQTDFVGLFTAQIQAYQGGSLLGTFTATSNSSGDPVFLGVLSNSSATDITRVVFSITSCPSLCDSTSFAIDTLLMTDIVAVPDVSTWLLVGSGLLGLALRLRRERSMKRS